MTITTEDLIKATAKAIEDKSVSIQKYLTQYGLTIPKNAQDQLDRCKYLTGEQLEAGLKKAWQKAEIHCLANRRPPMTEDEREKFQELIGDKKALVDDPDAQAERTKKYPHAKAGTFRRNPEHPSITLVDIVCVKCAAIRTIQATSIHVTTKCLKCQKDKV